MADRQHWTAAQVVEALTKNKGMVYYAAKSLGCSHTTIYNYAKRYASVREAMEAQDGEFVDTAELKLRQAVINGESWAVLFALRTKGKERGYVERSEVTGKDGNEFVIKVVYADVDIDTAAPTFSAETGD